MSADVDFVLTQHAARRALERRVKARWIAETILAPDREMADARDPSLRHAFKRLEEAGGGVLRVVYNSVAQPIRVVTVDFDRRVRRPL